MKSKPWFGHFVALAFVLGCAATVSGDNWPQWRGPRLDSVSTESNVPDRFSKDSGLVWRVPMPGPGGSSPIVWQSHVFVTSVEGDANGAKMFLLCIDADGNVEWKQQLEGGNQNSRDSANSASPSPSTDGKHVWAMMGNGILHCFTMDGELVWKKDLQEAYGKFNIQFGMTTTPILDNGRIYMMLIHGNMRNMRATSVGHVFCLDAESGEEIWYHKRLTDGVSENTHSYASPVIYRDAEREFLITHGADYVIGHSLVDGSELWRCGGINPKGSSYNPYLRFVASPSCAEGIIVVPTAKRGPVLGLKPNLKGEFGQQSDNFRWRIDRGTPDVASPLIYDGRVYLADEKGVLSCVDVNTGEILYQERLFASKHRSTPVGADGKVFIAGRDGKVHVVQAGPEFKLISETDLDEETTASPAISNGRIYIRTFDALYAFGS